MAMTEREKRERYGTAYQNANRKYNAQKLRPKQDIIRQYRKAAGLTQTELGRRISCSQKLISSWEHGYCRAWPWVLEAAKKALEEMEAQKHEQQ